MGINCRAIGYNGRYYPWSVRRHNGFCYGACPTSVKFPKVVTFFPAKGQAYGELSLRFTARENLRLHCRARYLGPA